MSSLEKQYAKAMHMLLSEGKDDDTIVTGLLNILKKKGHKKLLPRILRTFEEEKSNIDKLGRAIVTVVQKEDMENYKKEISRVSKTLGSIHEACEVVIDEHVVGGFSVQVEDKMIDSTYRRALVNLYKNITV